jgi:hypothetical protein
MAGTPGQEIEDGGAIRDEIRAELEATRAAFHALLESLSDEDWARGSGNPAWTVGEVMYHMTLAPRFLPEDVRLIRRLGWAPKLPGGLFNALMALLTRLGARNRTSQDVAEQYDAAHERMLAVLETIRDEEWSKGMDYPDWDPLLSGHVTLERLFHYPALHFQAHAVEVRQGLGDRYLAQSTERRQRAADLNPGARMKKQKATLRRLGEILGLDDTKVEAVLKKAASPARLNDKLLASLVEAGDLEEREAKDLGLMVSLHGLLDDDVELAETIRTGSFPQIPQAKVERIEDLVAFDEGDWLAVLTQANTMPPRGLRREAYAAVLVKRIETLYPSQALWARMMPRETSGLSEGIERLQPLFDKNEAPFAVDGFDSLDVEGIDPGEVDRLREAHARLTGLANSYPGLRLGELLDDGQLPPADKEARIAERVGLLSRFQAQNPDVEFLFLDYTPDSADVEALNFEDFAADEQRMVLSTLKAYQRMYAVTHDAAHTKLLVEMGHHSPVTIAKGSLEDFKATTGLDAAVAEEYYTSACASAQRKILPQGDAERPTSPEAGSGEA